MEEEHAPSVDVRGFEEAHGRVRWVEQVVYGDLFSVRRVGSSRHLKGWMGQTLQTAEGAKEAHNVHSDVDGRSDGDFNLVPVRADDLESSSEDQY